MTLRIGGALNGGLPSRTRVCDTRGGGGRGAPLPQAQELRSGGLSCVSWSHGLLRRHTALLWSSARGMAHSGPTWSLLHRRLNTSARLVPSAESQESGWVSDRDTGQMPGGAAGDLLQESGGWGELVAGSDPSRPVAGNRRSDEPTLPRDPLRFHFCLCHLRLGLKGSSPPGRDASAWEHNCANSRWSPATWGHSCD